MALHEAVIRRLHQEVRELASSARTSVEREPLGMLSLLVVDSARLLQAPVWMGEYGSLKLVRVRTLREVDRPRLPGLSGAGKLLAL